MTITVSEIAAAAAGARAAQNFALAKLLDDCAEALASAERGLENMTEHANEIDQRRFVAEEKAGNLEDELKDARQKAKEWYGDLVQLHKNVRGMTLDTERILGRVPMRAVPEWARDEKK